MIRLFLLKTARQVFLLPLHRVICDAAINTGNYLNNKTQFSCFCFVSASHIQVGPDYVQATVVFVCTVSADLFHLWRLAFYLKNWTRLSWSGTDVYLERANDWPIYCANLLKDVWQFLWWLCVSVCVTARSFYLCCGALFIYGWLLKMWRCEATQVDQIKDLIMATVLW